MQITLTLTLIIVSLAILILSTRPRKLELQFNPALFNSLTSTFMIIILTFAWIVSPMSIPALSLLVTLYMLLIPITTAVALRINGVPDVTECDIFVILFALVVTLVVQILGLLVFLFTVAAGIFPQHVVGPILTSGCLVSFIIPIIWYLEKANQQQSTAFALTYCSLAILIVSYCVTGYGLLTYTAVLSVVVCYVRALTSKNINRTIDRTASTITASILTAAILFTSMQGLTQ